MLRKLISQNLVQCLPVLRQKSLAVTLNHPCLRHCSSLFEPDYLESGKSQIPLYDVLNIQLKGYDYTVLESYQKFVHSMANCIGIDVEDSWATPPQHLNIMRYKPQSTVVDADYKVTIYERNVQIADVPTTLYPVLLSVLSSSLPEGVSLSVHEHQQEHDQIRYVPDLELKELKVQLDDMGGPSKLKRQ